MNQTDIAQIVRELRSKHPEPAGACDLSEFELTLGLVPEQSVWRVADGRPAVYALGPGDRLFTVMLGEPPETGLPAVATLSVARIGHSAAAAEAGALGQVGAPASQEPSSPAPPVSSGSRRNLVTDIWGNPLDKRGRRR